MGRDGNSIGDAALYRRGELITTLARGLSVGLALLALLLLWSSPETRPLPGLAVGAGYIAYSLGSGILVRRRPLWRRRAKIAHDLVDALAVGVGAALSGGLDSPIWLLLYAHVVAVSVRGGLRYAMAMGVLDSLIVLALSGMPPGHPLGTLHSLTLLFCAFMGGTTSSYLHEVHRLRKEYLRNVSHEFRTPLTVIRGYSEFLRDDGLPAGSSLPEIMQVVIESCDQMIDMVDTLIEVGRVEQEGERVLDVRPHDLKEVAAASVHPLRLFAEKKGVALSFEFPGEPLYVQGDGPLLHHLVRKLVDNALKFSRPGSRVVVRGGTQGEDGTLEVEDSGIGIAPEHLPRIFEKFYMADGGLARRRGGSGVGLYLVREIVRLHRGTIDVRSAPGRGSLFSVRLPRRFRGERPDAARA